MHLQLLSFPFFTLGNYPLHQLLDRHRARRKKHPPIRSPPHVRHSSPYRSAKRSSGIVGPGEGSSAEDYRDGYADARDGDSDQEREEGIAESGGWGWIEKDKITGTYSYRGERKRSAESEWGMVYNETKRDRKSKRDEARCIPARIEGVGEGMYICGGRDALDLGICIYT